MTACSYPDARVSPRSERESRIRLFCFPYAGGSAQVFRDWEQELPEQIEVSGVRLPGRGERVREKPFTELLPLVQVLTDELAPHTGEPYALFGHSVGAIIAFEVARSFRRERLPLPLHLFVSAYRAPQLAHTSYRSFDLPSADLIDRLRKLNGTPSQILESPAMLEFFLPVIRADLQMVQTYKYSVEAPLECPISAFGGRQDPEETPEVISAWREQTTASFSQQMFAGDHFFLHAEHRSLLQTISQQLLSAREAGVI